jgi:hypothetical protein
MIVLRETVGVLAEARKNGWDVPMLVQAAGYSAQSHASRGQGVAVQPYRAAPFLPGAADYRELISPRRLSLGVVRQADLSPPGVGAAW